MSKHKKRKHKRVADPYNDYMQKRHAYWAACAKKGELTEEQAHTCDELEMFVSAVIVFSDISPQDPPAPAVRHGVSSLPAARLREGFEDRRGNCCQSEIFDDNPAGGHAQCRIHPSAGYAGDLSRTLA